MMGGIYLGGFYTGQKSKVPTFAFNRDGDYYYCRVNDKGFFQLKKLTTFFSHESMYHAAPEILAFWSE